MELSPVGFPQGVRTVATRTDVAQSITDHFAKKVLDDTRPTERPKLGLGINPRRGGRRGGLIFSDEPFEPQESFTCQRTLIALLRRHLAAAQLISFPAERG